MSEGLRGPEGQARAVHVAAPTAGAAQAALTVVRARVPDGCSLRRWLFGFADALVVVAPPHLRAELAEKAARIASVYDNEAVDP